MTCVKTKCKILFCGYDHTFQDIHRALINTDGYVIYMTQTFNEARDVLVSAGHILDCVIIGYTDQSRERNTFIEDIRTTYPDLAKIIVVDATLLKKTNIIINQGVIAQSDIRPCTLIEFMLVLEHAHEKKGIWFVSLKL